MGRLAMSAIWHGQRILRSGNCLEKMNHTSYKAPEISSFDIETETGFCQSVSNSNSLGFSPESDFIDIEEED